MTIFLAGHETTALTLAWAWFLLATHPEAEEKLLTEVQTTLGDRPPTVALRPLLAGHSTRTVVTVVRRGRGQHPAIRACRRALAAAAGAP